MRPLLAALLLIVPATVFGQTLVFSLVEASADGGYAFGPNSGCPTIGANYSGALPAPDCDGSMEVWLTSGTCGDTPQEPELDGQSVGQLTTLQGSFNVPLNRLPATADGGTICGATDVEREFRVCGLVKYALFPNTCGGTETPLRASPLVIRYDAKAPPAPVIHDVVALDRALSVQMERFDDTTELRVQLRREDETDFSDAATVTVNNARIEGLENGVTYVVRAFALDAARNESPASNEASGTPVETSGFFDQYTLAGGQEQGGCGAVGGPALVFAALVVGLALRRRKS